VDAFEYRRAQILKHLLGPIDPRPLAIDHYNGQEGFEAYIKALIDGMSGRACHKSQ
jgi:hypothetical protein